jgi:membrane fusion protein (multidrug efflux system)
MADTIRLIRGSSPPSQAIPQSAWKKRGGPIAIAVVAVLVVTLVYRWFISILFYVETENSYVQKEIYPVSARIMGYVKEVNVEEGMSIKQGDTLLVLDDSDFKIELSFKQSKYLTTLADVKRARRLNHTDAVSQSELERAEALLVATKADLDGTLSKISYTRVYSPVTGTVAKKSIQQGQFVQPGQGLIVIVKEADAWVKANIKETQISKIHLGMKAQVEVDAFPGLIFEGTVSSIFPASGATLSLLPPENATGNFTKIVQNISVKIQLENKQPSALAAATLPQLKPGMSAVTTIRIR